MLWPEEANIARPARFPVSRFGCAVRFGTEFSTEQEKCVNRRNFQNQKSTHILKIKNLKHGIETAKAWLTPNAAPLLIEPGWLTTRIYWNVEFNPPTSSPLTGAESVQRPYFWQITNRGYGHDPASQNWHPLNRSQPNRWLFIAYTLSYPQKTPSEDRVPGLQLDRSVPVFARLCGCCNPVKFGVWVDWQRDYTAPIFNMLISFGGIAANVRVSILATDQHPSEVVDVHAGQYSRLATLRPPDAPCVRVVGADDGLSVMLAFWLKDCCGAE